VPDFVGAPRPMKMGNTRSPWKDIATPKAEIDMIEKRPKDLIKEVE
jgi:hypothetical protein